MGNQGASNEGTALVCEWIWNGEIGEVTKVECATDRPIWPQGLNMPEKEDDTLTITVTTDAAEKDGIVFQSTDYGATWEYKGLVQIAN